MILNSHGLKIVILLQYPFQVRSLVEYLPCKLRVGYNLPVSVVLQGTGTDIQPLERLDYRKGGQGGEEASESKS